MAEISVIIPVYNREKYIEKCLESVLSQTFADIEIICINDGSSDQTLEILQTYANKDSRFRIINLKTNKGASNARNIAIKESNSPYLFFLDSDDWIEPNCLELLYKQITEDKTEIAFGAYNYYSNGTKIGDQLQEIINLKSDKNIDSYRLLITIGGKLFSKNFIIQNSILFKENFITAEDFIFNFQCYSYGAKFSTVKQTLYNYDISATDSATSSMHIQNSENKALMYFVDSGYFDMLSDFYKLIYINNIINCALSWYAIYKNKKLKKQIQECYVYLKKNIPNEILIQCTNFQEFKNIAKTFWQNVFSLESWMKLIKKKFIK